MPTHMCAGQYTAESVPSFHHGSPGHQIQVIRLDTKFTYEPSSHPGFYVYSKGFSLKFTM